MNNQGTLIATLTQIRKGGVREVVTNRSTKEEKELESYENIIENLSRLKVEASERNHGEAEAIELIRANLSVLRDCLLYPSYSL